MSESADEMKMAAEGGAPSTDARPTLPLAAERHTKKRRSSELRASATVSYSSSSSSSSHKRLCIEPGRTTRSAKGVTPSPRLPLLPPGLLSVHCTPSSSVGKLGKGCSTARAALSEELLAASQEDAEAEEEEEEGETEEVTRAGDEESVRGNVIIDLDAAAPFLCLSGVGPISHAAALEASYLASYGREYYGHLFESEDRRHRDRRRRRRSCHRRGAGVKEKAGRASPVAAMLSSTTPKTTKNPSLFAAAVGSRRTVTVEGPSVAAAQDGNTAQLEKEAEAAAAAAAAMEELEADEEAEIEMEAEATTETEATPRVPSFLSDQPHIIPSMRGVLVDWLAELCHTYGLSSQTLHLAVSLVDRTLQKTATEAYDNNWSKKEEGEESTDAGVEAGAGEAPWAVRKGEFQCLGCACLLIASKLEETNPIGTKDLVFMSDNTYSRAEIHAFERRVCHLLDFRLYETTSFSFADRFLRASDACAGLPPPSLSARDPANSGYEGLAVQMSPPNQRLNHMASYLLELSLLPPELSQSSSAEGSDENGRKPVVTGKCKGYAAKASRTAAAAVYLARATLGVRDHRGRIWNETMAHYTGYDEASLESTVRLLHKCQNEAGSSELGCIYERYSKKDRMGVAKRPALCVEDLGFGNPFW